VEATPQLNMVGRRLQLAIRQLRTARLDACDCGLSFGSTLHGEQCGIDRQRRLAL
jgi:hypothetical protein